MHDDELKTLFDKMAPDYDKRWARMAPINGCLHYLLESVFAGLPATASILCVGVGTGTELLHLAGRFPGWQFTAVEPSGAMLEVCRRRVDEAGFGSRCSLHEGYVAALPSAEQYDAATCFLVSQFIVEQAAREAFFRAIAVRLKPGGILASSDLASDINSLQYEALLRAWLNMMAEGGVTAEGLDQMRAAYARDVAVLPPAEIAAIISAGGFVAPTQFFQAGLIHAWFSKRAAGPV